MRNKICLSLLLLGTSVANVAFAQKQNLRGIVVDENNEPIIGASVVVRGTSTGTISGPDGKFTISASPNDAILISYIGFLEKGITIKEAGQSEVKIVLLEDTKALDEMVVIGYGTAKRKDFAGSVSSVKLENSPLSLSSSTNALETLKGSLPGLDVGYTNSAGGEPGILVRGQNSISGSNDPLIVVDGVIYMGSINDINPNDIASVDVLKDASSAAVYGSRSANGVICITTKKGAEGKPIVSFNLSNSIQDWAITPNYVTADQWVEATAARNGYKSAEDWLTGQQLDNYKAGRSTNWLDLVKRQGYQQDYQASISGATKGVNYYLSSAYTDDKGIVEGDDYNRITIKGKIDAKVNDWIKLGADASYTQSDYSGNSANLWSIQQMSPYGVPYRNDGSLEKYPNGTNEAVNPLWGVGDGTQDNREKYYNYRLNAFAELTIPQIKGLSYRINYSTNTVEGSIANFVHENYYTFVGAYDNDDRYSSSTQRNYLASANGYDRNTKTNSWVLDNILTYSNRFGGHQVDLTAVATRDGQRYNYKQSNGSNFANNGNTTLGIEGLAFATTQKFSRSSWRKANIGYLARAAYNYNDTYYFTGSYRRDGASVFGKNTKWGNFGAVGLAWRISNEQFMRGISFLNDLKLKASWGRNGNQGIGAYTTLSQVSAGSSGGIRVTFGNSGAVQYGINQSTIGNENLGWETTESWNYGFESRWLNDRLQVDLDIYFSKTYDQLFSRTIPVMTGFSSIYSSMGEVQNRGIELSIHSTNIKNRDFTWTTGVTFWLNRDKLNHLYGEDLDGDGKEDDDLGNGLFIGESIHSIFGYKQVGIVQTSDTEYMAANGVSAGTPKYEDHNGDGKITSDDRYIIGNTAANFRLNISNTLTYRNLELYCMLTGNFGGSGYYQQSNKAAYIIGGSGDSFGVNSLYVPFWTESNPSNTYPAATYTGDSYFKGLQSRQFIRLQDLSLSYTFRQAWVKKSLINNLKLFVTGKNLFTITDWEGGDPEIGNSIVSGSYPVARSYSLGVNISF